MMLMPSATRRHCGIKVITTHSGERDRPNVQGLYLLFDVDSLAPIAVLDAVSLTATRTAAVSLVGIRHLAPRPGARAVVWGAGVQALAHARALCADGLANRVSVVGRSDKKVQAAVGLLRAEGLPVDAGTPGCTRDADIVVCATASPVPVLMSDAVPDHAVVVAIGSHTTDAREVDGALMGRSQVVIESWHSARAEAGDVTMALDEGSLTERAVVPLAELVRGEIDVNRDRPRVFKFTGMGWEDLVVATAEFERHSEQRHRAASNE